MRRLRKLTGMLAALTLLVSCAAPAIADEAWTKEYTEAWAEERKLAKEFTDHFSEKLTDEDLLTFEMADGPEYSYVLGKTTPVNMMEDGWQLQLEEDGVFSVCDRNGNPTGVTIASAHGSVDEPIITMNAFWQENMDVTYCGFDGAIGSLYMDPDQCWYPDPTGLELGELLSESGGAVDLWDGLINWLETDYGAGESEEGICEAEISLRDGRILYVSSHYTQVRISLNGFSD